MAETKRTPRTLETRERSERQKQWEVPDMLPTPDPQEGVVFRWIRTATLGASDPTNVNRSRREGWEPVNAADHPEIAVMSDKNTRFEGCIEVGGLLLCKCPAEFMEQRAKHYAGVTRAQSEAVDKNFMKENDPRMPLFSEKKTTVSFGKG